VGNPYAPPGNAPRPPAPAPQPPGPPQHPVPAPPGAPRPAERRASRARKPPPPPPDPKLTQEAGRRVGTFGLLLLASVATDALPLPFQAASLGFVLAALVVGIRALRFAWRSGLRGMLIPTLAAGLTFTLLLTISTAGLLVLWPIQLDRQQCLQQALTVTSTSACETDFERAVTDRMTSLSTLGTSGTGS